MATRGVPQCQKLTVWYCEHGGSSQAVRDFLQSGQLLQWAKARPSVEIQVRVRNGKHPFVQANYLTSIQSKNQDLPHAHQICLRSNQQVGNANRSHITLDIPGTLDQLYNRSGRKMTQLTQPVYTQTPSIQGVWTPALNLHLTPKFPLVLH